MIFTYMHDSDVCKEGYYRRYLASPHSLIVNQQRIVWSCINCKGYYLSCLYQSSVNLAIQVVTQVVGSLCLLSASNIQLVLLINQQTSEVKLYSSCDISRAEGCFIMRLRQAGLIVKNTIMFTDSTEKHKLNNE